MKFLIIFALCLATAFALPSEGIQSRNLVVPAGKPQGRITRGQDATTGQFPYQVGLILSRGLPNYSWCGGSLLSHEWVLTAAHCAEGTISLTVILGTIDRTTAEIHHKVDKKNIIIHEGWNTDTSANDISLVKIPYTEYSKRIQPVQLPAIARSYASYAGDNVIASGWGRISDDANGRTKYLQWARLNVIQNRICNQSFIGIAPSNICTSTIGGVNICDGDSGGPIVLESSRVQIGLTSFGDDICITDMPSVFTRVTSYLGWIKKYTGVAY